MCLIVGAADAARSPCRRRASWCARSSSSTTARTDRSALASARTPGRHVPRPARVHPVRAVAPRARRAPRDLRATSTAAGTGDVPTLTVAEYRALPRAARLGYRLFRNPLVMFGVGPIVAMLIGPRIVARDARPRMRRSVFGTDVALVVMVAALCWLIGWRALPAGRAPLVLLAGAVGHLAVLRPAPVRGRLLGERRRLELRRRGAARQLLPEAAEGAAVLHRATSACTTSTT